jgi:hypothetical protein
MRLAFLYYLVQTWAADPCRPAQQHAIPVPGRAEGPRWAEDRLSAAFIAAADPAGGGR